MPEGEDLATFARSGATLVHPSLDPQSGADRARALAALGRRLPGDRRLPRHLAGPADPRGTLATIRAQVKAAGITRTALIMVGRVLGETGFSESRLYAADHSHVLRPRTPASQASASGTEPEAPSGG